MQDLYKPTKATRKIGLYALFSFFIIIVFSSSYSFVNAETSSSSINWASYRYVENNFCKQGGSCNLSTLNVINQTVTNINTTGDLDVAGDSIFKNNVTMEKSLFVADRVGIGTNYPKIKFEISGDDDSYSGAIINLHGDETNQYESGRIRFTEADISDYARFQGSYIHYNGADNLLHIGVHNTANTLISSDVNAITIERSTANVGIGTDDPQFEVDMVGSDVRIRNPSTTDGAETKLLFTTTSNNNDNEDYSSYIAGYRNSGSENSLTFGTWGGGVGVPASQKVTIRGDGDVGIGTTTPQSILELVEANNPTFTIRETATGVAGSTRTAGIWEFVGMSNTDVQRRFARIQVDSIDATNGGEDGRINFDTIDDGVVGTRMVIKEGNVGIGTTDPSAKLEVSTTTAYDGVIAGGAYVGNWGSSSNAMFAHKDVKDTQTSYALIQANDGETYLNSASGQDLNFMRGNAYIGAWTNTGLGIGTSSPVFKNHILTSSNDDGLLIQINSGTTGVTTGLYFKTSTDSTVGYASSGIVLEDNGHNNAGADLHIVRKILPLAGTKPGVADRIMSFYDNMVEVLNNFNIVGDLRATTLNQSTLKTPNDNGISSTGLQGSWSLNNNADDYSGNGNDGTVTGATLTDGRFGNAYEFNGVDNSISIPDSDDLSFTNKIFSISLNFKINSTDSGSAILYKGSSALNREYAILTDSNGHLNVRIYESGNSSIFNQLSVTDKDYRDGVSYNLILTCNGSNGYLYVNNVQKDTEPLSVNLGNLDSDLYFGSYSNTALFFTGSLDEVMIFNRSLSSYEVKSLYESNKEHISQEAYLLNSGGTINGDLNVEGNITGNQIYGGMWYHNHTATTLTFTDADTWYPLFFTDATDLNGFSYVGGFGVSSNLTAQVSGKYQASYMGIGSGQNNHVYLTTILIDGIEKPECGNHHKMAAGGDVITQSGVCIISINAGQTIELASQDMGGTGDGEYYGGNINLVRVGDI